MSEVVESRQKILGSTQPGTVLSFRMLKRWQEGRRRRGFRENAAHLLKELEAELEPKTVDAVEAMSSLAAIKGWQGRYQEAAVLDTVTLPLSKKFLSIEHPTTL